MASNIDYVADILTKIQKNASYKEDARQAISQWNRTSEELSQLRNQVKDTEKKSSESRIKRSSEKNLEREQDKDRQINSLKEQVNELTLRLSTIAGDRMSDGNPNITDLSDPYRPTKLAEKFREVYNEEWTEAFQYYDTFLRDEDDILKELASFPENIYGFCRKLSQQQLEELERYTDYICDSLINPAFKIDEHSKVSVTKENASSDSMVSAKDEAKRMLMKFQKGMARVSTKKLFDLYCAASSYKKKPDWIKNAESSQQLKTYISKLLELIWLMISQDPPIVLSWLNPDQKVDKASFTFYNKSGDVVKMTVWPAVCLHEKGALMAKGVVHTK